MKKRILLPLKQLRIRRIRDFVCLLVVLLSVNNRVSAQFSNVPVTGFNADIIADGSNGTASVSTTADVDGGDWVFVSSTFNPGSGICASGVTALPASGTITSTNATTATGIAYTFQSYGSGATTNNNALRLLSGTSGTLTLTTPQAASNLYFVCLGGGGAASFTATINFADATSETVTPVAAPDWCGGAATYKLTTQQYYRILRTATTCSGAGCQYLYEIPAALSGTNYSKLINSITFNCTSGGILSVLAVGSKAPCAVPAGPSGLTFSGQNTSNITGAFNTSSATGYLVVRYPSGSTATAPVNGSTYTAGASLGLGTIVSSSTTTGFTASALSANTAYDFYVYTYNTGTSCGGPMYSTSSLMGTASTTSCGAPTLGTVTAGVRTIKVGATGYDATTITDAIANITTNGLNTPTIIELQSNYSSTGETYPITFPYSPCVGSVNTLTVRPATGANGLSISSSNAGATIDLNGAAYVTIDGRPGGTGSSISVTAAGSLNTTNLNIVNTNTAGTTVKLDNGANNNTIKFCDLQGQNTTNANVPASAAGVIYFENTGAAGNDNNTITYCNIHSSGASSFPSLGIYSLGTNITTGYSITSNDGNTVTNNNIYDYFNATSGVNSAGLELNYGNNAWTVTNNSFFQTASRALTASYNRAIWIIPYRSAGNVGNGFQVSNNYIGGSAPQCGGTAYDLTTSGYFEGIRMEIADNTTAPNASIIQNNIIKNISITSSTSSDLIHAISVLGGSGLASILNNTIGVADATGGTTTGGITLNSTASSVAGHILFLGGTLTLTIQNNIISDILVSSANTYLSGIYTGSGIIANISNNTIGSATEPKSIYFSNSTTSTTTGRYIHGMRIVPTSASSFTIANNTVAGIWSDNAYTGSSGQLAGIYISSSVSNISGGVTGNIVKNLYTAAATTGTTTASSLIGIHASSTSNISNVTGNVISSLTNAASTGNTNIIGLYTSGSTTVVSDFSKNFIHSIVAPNSTTATISGIFVNGGTSTYSNNMIRLGINADGTSYTKAVATNGIVSATTSANNFYNNSVYIGGTNVESTSNSTYAFRRTATSGTYNLLNNIFVNNRSNATTGGTHYTVYFTTAATGVTINRNLYYFTGTGGMFAYNGTANVASYTPSWLTSDLQSVFGDAQFINPTGNTTAVNLHINTSVSALAESHGIAISGITNDIDGDSRSGYSGSAANSAPDIGADEFAGIYLSTACAGVPAPGNTIATTTSLCVSGTSNLSVDNSYALNTGVQYQWQLSLNGTVWSDIAGATLFYTTSPTITATTNFRLRVICTTGADTAYSTPVAVVVHPLPVISVTPSQAAFCATGSATLTASGANTYSWSPSATLNVATGNTVIASPTTLTTYTVTGTDIYNCVNSGITTVGPIDAITPIATATDVCTANLPITVTVTPIIQSPGSSEYKLTDTLGNVLVDWQSGNSLSYTPTATGLYKCYVFARNTSCVTTISDTGVVTFSAGFNALITTTNATCTNGDGSLTISNTSGPGLDNILTWYSNDFSSSTLSSAQATLSNNASITSGRAVITPSATSNKGGLTILNPTGITTNALHVTFDMTADNIINTYGTGGADGIAYSFGDDAIYSSSVTNGAGSKLRVVFDAAANSSENNNHQGCYITYGYSSNTQMGDGSAGVLASNTFTDWKVTTDKPVDINITEDGKLTLKWNGIVIFSDVQLPPAYLAANKSTWQHLFTAFTGGDAMRFAVDNLNIKYGTETFNYGSSPAGSGTVPTTWQTTPVFSGLSGGDSLDLWVANPTAPATCNKLLGTFGVGGPFVTSNLGSADPSCVSTEDGYILLKVPANGNYNVSFNKNGGNLITQNALASANDGINEFIGLSLTQGTYTNIKITNTSSCVSNTIAGPITLVAPNAVAIAPSSTSSGAVNQPGAGTQYYTDASCNLITAVTSPNNLGQVTASVTVNAAPVASTTGEPFVGRYVEITPTQNATLPATIKLYFTAADFTAYNNSASVGTATYPAILSDGSNFRVKAFHGTAASGTTGPGGAYDNSNADLIQPTSVVWNATNNFWEVTLNSPNGFSGFFGTTNTATPLSITISDISAKNKGSVNIVDWKTATESADARFEIQRSKDAHTFVTIGSVAGTGKAPSSYAFTDNKPYSGVNYYRLILTDAVGFKEYSKVVSAEVKGNASFHFDVFPNPVSNNLTVNVSEVNGTGMVEVTDITGRVLITKSVANSNSAIISLASLTSGIYIVKYHDDVHQEAIKVNKN